jgi:hypothetical protein
LFRSKCIAGLTQEIDDLQKFRVCLLATLNEKSNITRRRALVSIKLLLYATQTRSIAFVHADPFADAGRRFGTELVTAPSLSRLGDRSFSLNHLMTGRPGINVLKSAIHL